MRQDEVENLRRKQELDNLKDRYEKTQDHLTNNLDKYEDKDNIEHAIDLQETRKNEIENLEDKLSNKETTMEEQRENLEENFENLRDYVLEYSDEFSRTDLNVIKDKQKNRRRQMEKIDKKIEAKNEGK